MPTTVPTEIKKLEGNRGKRPLNPDEPNPRKVFKLEPPKHLDDDSKEAWIEFEPILRRLGLLTEADVWLFENLCTARGRLMMIQRSINQLNETQDMNGLVSIEVTMSGDGEEFVKTTQSALATMERQYFEIFRKYAVEFGLTPKGRVGLSVNNGPKKEESVF